MQAQFTGLLLLFHLFGIDRAQTTVGCDLIQSLPDSAIVATSNWGNLDSGCRAQNSRVTSGIAWCAGTSTANDWTDYITIDLGYILTIDTIATYGRANSNQWVTHYNFFYSQDSITYIWYSNASLVGNTDRNSEVAYAVNLVAQYLRFQPVSRDGYASMRVAACGLSLSPTNHPSQPPTYNPSSHPTPSPTKMPSKFPTNIPTKMPSKMPTITPTLSPTVTPTNMPTAEPTLDPTWIPTAIPTPQPTEKDGQIDEGMTTTKQSDLTMSAIRENSKVLTFDETIIYLIIVISASIILLCIFSAVIYRKTYIKKRNLSKSVYSTQTVSGTSTGPMQQHTKHATLQHINSTSNLSNGLSLMNANQIQMSPFHAPIASDLSSVMIGNELMMMDMIHISTLMGIDNDVKNDNEMDVPTPMGDDIDTDEGTMTDKSNEIDDDPINVHNITHGYEEEKIDVKNVTIGNIKSGEFIINGSDSENDLIPNADTMK